ncbi:MAG: dTMP kinase [Candidatus Methanodesulfokora sp.]
MRSGGLIALEGIDGSGTTTHSKILYERILGMGVKAFLTHEPTDGPIGMIIRDVLSGRLKAEHDVLALLFAADRLSHVHEISDLMKNCFVITDRYLFSSIAYQGLFLPESWVRLINSRAPLPDLAILLDIDADTAINRIKNRKKREIFEEKEKLEKIRERFLRLKDEFNMFVVDSRRPVEVVADEIWDIFRRWAGI